MSFLTFVLPQDPSDLLNETSQNYYVKNVLVFKEIPGYISDAEVALKEEGAEFIVYNFDTYFSVIHHLESLPEKTVMKAFGQLSKAVDSLNKNLVFVLEDRESIVPDLRTKYLNIIKMLVYLYSSLLLSIEKKIGKKNALDFGYKNSGRKKKNDVDIKYDYKKDAVLLNLSNVMNSEISFFWDPPIVEMSFVNLITDVCYCYLEDPSIKANKELRMEVFHLLGILVTKYNHGSSFVMRMFHLLKQHDHLTTCLPEGIKLLVEQYHCKSLVSSFVKAVMEWQTADTVTDTKGMKNCSLAMIEMALLMPKLMIEEVEQLAEYLAHDSYTLRNAILTIITELISTILTKPELTDEEQQSRNYFFQLLEEHMWDVSVHVRTKVFQQFARLMKDNAIPLNRQNEILKKLVIRLNDKGALARKAAANSVTEFLKCNVFNHTLRLKDTERELKEKFEIYEKKGYPALEKMDTFEGQAEQIWEEREDQMRTVVEEKLTNEQEVENCEDTEKSISEEDILCLKDGRYEEVFDICLKIKKKSLETWEAVKAKIDGDEVDMYVAFIKKLFMEIFVSKANEQALKDFKEADVNEFMEMFRSITFLKAQVEFLRIIGSAVEPMVGLLQWDSVGVFQEAADFFLAAYQFEIDNAMEGVFEMLKIMHSNDQDRKDIVVEKFKTMYLVTSTKNMEEHSRTIVKRLIHLVQTIPNDSARDLRTVIKEWTAKGNLNNHIIDMLWKLFRQNSDGSDLSRAALKLIGTMALGRKTIVSRNIMVISVVAFGDRGSNDMLLVMTACEALQSLGNDKQDITDKDPPFRIAANEQIWKDLTGLMIQKFQEPVPFYNKALTATIRFIYGVCSNPMKICKTFFENTLGAVYKKTTETSAEVPMVADYIIVRCLLLLGEAALQQLFYLDENVYREDKRRQYLRESNSKRRRSSKNKKMPLALLRKSMLNASTNSAADSTLKEAEESMLDSGEAEDSTSELILYRLEHAMVTGKGIFANYAPLIKKICEKQVIYNDEDIQCAAVTALCRFMLVSSTFCEQNMQLVITILDKTTFTEVKKSILLHCSNLMERFPNVVEPWSSKLYNCLRDSDIVVRETALYILADLILRDMILVQGHISEMARCIVDKEEKLRSMSESFFGQLSQKSNKLYNILPDVFSHLCEIEELEEDELRHIMKFLFGHIDKNKQMECLVDRFCLKFGTVEEEKKCRNISYCLTLVNYTDKGLVRLLENFPLYKHLLLVDDIYALFKQVLTEANKVPTMKPIVAELEQKILSVFDIDENDDPENKDPGRVAKTPLKMLGNKNKGRFLKPKGSAVKGRKKRLRKVSDSEEESSEGDKENAAQNQDFTPRQSGRNRKTKTFVEECSSDSD